MPMDTQPASLSNGMFWAGWIISGLVMLFLAFDGVTKIIKVAPVVEASEKLGIPPHTLLAIGIVLLACTTVYSIPRTAVLGAILLTGASASVKGYALSAPFAMGKFALRGLAQSLARELQPQGIHVAHFVIDGGIRSANRPEPADKPDSMLDPDGIALSYLQVLQQPRNAWAWEIELRPWVERF